MADCCTTMFNNFKKEPRKHFTVASILFALIFGGLTIGLMGNAFDNANFPGSNLALQRDDGKPIEVEGNTPGYLLKNSTCSNFIEYSELDTEKNTCGSVEEVENSSDEKDWNPKALTNDNSDDPLPFKGWIVAPNCKKNSDSDKNDKSTQHCSTTLFGARGNLANSGVATATFFTLFVALFTWGSVKKAEDVKLKGLIGVWGVATAALLVTSAFFFVAFCDKIDAGLGHFTTVNEKPVHICFTADCTYPFSTFFGVWAGTAVSLLIPLLLLSAEIFH
jgi:hypothetical protein